MNLLSIVPLPWIQVASACFAVLSAILWIASAWSKLPKTIRLYAHHSEVPPGIPHTHENIGDVFSPELSEMHEILARQSRLSGCAALSAGAAAVLQVLWIATA
ncbi:MAG TPA: hypothetical protein VMV19_18335 [Xanthobacteraceae bacterium]|nr:hypothetical protein [Xanthobacteraceae bacterium]